MVEVIPAVLGPQEAGPTTAGHEAGPCRPFGRP